MRFMNEHDIADACVRWRDHPVLGPASETLRNLADCANHNSDGWHSWPKPARSAAKLMELIEGDGTWEFRSGEREDATPARLRAAYSPIKAFLTRQNLTSVLVAARGVYGGPHDPVVRPGEDADKFYTPPKDA